MNYRHITVAQDAPSDTHRGRPVYMIRNRRSGDVLGRIVWYATWKRWTADFQPDTVWSADCLRDVQDAIGKITKANRTTVAGYAPYGKLPT